MQEQPDKSKGRIIQINLWYPSAGATKKISFADYISLIGKELDISPANKDAKQKGINKYSEWPLSAGADKEKFEKFINSKPPMQAFADAKWLTHRHPLVMLVHGFAADHAYLAEYLAGHGYVVMEVPVKGTETYELDYEGNGMESQVQDYEFALTIVKNEFPVATDKLAVAGFSFGGQSAVALSLRNNKIKAIISLDGGMGSAFGAQLLSKQSYYDPKRIVSPILHLYNPTDTFTDLSWFDSIGHADRFLVAMKNMQHGHFTSFGLLNRVIPGIMGKTVADPGNGYEAVMWLSKEFLDLRFNKSMKGPTDFFDKQKAVHSWIGDCIGKTAIKISAG